METLFIHRGPLQAPLVEFAKRSLSFCTTIDTRADDSVAVTACWPVEGFSSGEKVLWSLLESFTEGDLYRGFDKLDNDNCAAIAALMAATFGTVSV